MTELPSLETALAELAQLADIDTIDPDSPITEVDLESVDVLEWLYELEERLDVRIDESQLQGLESMTVRDLYEALIGEVRTQLDRQAGEDQP